MGSCEASHARVGLGTNCIEMCPSKRGPQGEGTRGLRLRLAQDPPGGPKVPVAVCPQQGQCRAAPCALQASAARAGGRVHLLCQHCLQHPVFGKHRRWGPPAEVPEAGAGGWRQGSGERWPGWVAHPGHAVHLLMLGVGARPGSSGLGVMAGSSGAEGQQAAVHQQQVPQRPAAPTFCQLGWEGSFFFFLFVFCPFLLLCVCLFHRAGSRQVASRSF